MAFSIAIRVRISAGRVLSRTSCIARRPAWAAASAFKGSFAGMPFRPAGLIPMSSIAIDMVLAVNCPPQAPAVGQAAFSTHLNSLASILPAVNAPTASKTSCTVSALPLWWPWSIEPP